MVKKGFESLSKSGYKTDATYKDIFQNLTFENVQSAAQGAIEAFLRNDFDVVEVVYSEFKNAGSQAFTLERMLPIPKAKKVAGTVKLILFLSQTKSN